MCVYDRLASNRADPLRCVCHIYSIHCNGKGLTIPPPSAHTAHLRHRGHQPHFSASTCWSDYIILLEMIFIYFYHIIYTGAGCLHLAPNLSRAIRVLLPALTRPSTIDEYINQKSHSSGPHARTISALPPQHSSTTTDATTDATTDITNCSNRISA